MHIMEGWMPAGHALAWTAATAPIVLVASRRVARQLEERPEARLLLGAVGGFAFVLSSLKLPSLTGSCSHPTGVGLGAVLFGPSGMIVLGTIVLVFQALLLAHGGLTTLGANAFSLAVVGSLVAWAVHGAAKRARLPFSVRVFLAAALSDLATYATTSLQLALAFPDPVSGVAGALVKFQAVFLATQLPLAVAEGVLAAMVAGLLARQAPAEVRERIPGLAEVAP